MYKNGGKERHRKGQPPEVNAYDFPDKELGRAIPYGVYDTTLNEGRVSVGTDHDTAEFAVEAICSWWGKMGEFRYPKAKELLILADGSGSNGVCNRLWKYQLQKLSSEKNLKIMVCHFPPGTSKWNKIEHRMFSRISQNRRGRPLTSHEVIVQLIAATSTEKGLKIEAEIDSKLSNRHKNLGCQNDFIKHQTCRFSRRMELSVFAITWIIYFCAFPKFSTNRKKSQQLVQVILTHFLRSELKLSV